MPSGDQRRAVSRGPEVSWPGGAAGGGDDPESGVVPVVLGRDGDVGVDDLGASGGDLRIGDPLEGVEVSGGDEPFGGVG